MTPLAAIAILACAMQDTPESHTGAKASIVLKVGIVGGIVAPTVELSVEIVAGKDAVTVRVMKLKDGKPVVKTGSMTRKEFDALLKDIAPAWELPVENPRDSEDIYGLDTGVTIESGAKSWRNGAPGGCDHGTSKVQPTAAQRDAFKKIVDRIMKEGEARATRD